MSLETFEPERFNFEGFEPEKFDFETVELETVKLETVEPETIDSKKTVKSTKEKRGGRVRILKTHLPKT